MCKSFLKIKHKINKKNEYKIKESNTPQFFPLSLNLQKPFMSAYQNHLYSSILKVILLPYNNKCAFYVDTDTGSRPDWFFRIWSVRISTTSVIPVCPIPSWSSSFLLRVYFSSWLIRSHMHYITWELRTSQKLRNGFNILNTNKSLNSKPKRIFNYEAFGSMHGVVKYIRMEALVVGKQFTCIQNLII